MKNKKGKRQFTATSMRTALGILLFTLLAGMIGGFYFIYSFLSTEAADVAETQTKAKSLDSELQHLINLQRQLSLNKSTIEKTEKIVAESQSYRYQDQIINDLTGYASQTEVSITSFTFQDSLAATTPGAASANTPTPTQGGSLKSIFVSVLLEPNLEYTKLLRFMQLIEGNLTRMQISELSLTKGEQGGTVGAQTLSIEVYVK